MNATLDFAANLEPADAAWAAPLLESLRARLFLIELFKESLRAVHERGDRGTRLMVVELGGDRFELQTGDRKVGFERRLGEARVIVSRRGFPVSLIPVGLDREEIAIPDDPGEASELVLSQIKGAVKILFRRRD